MLTALYFIVIRCPCPEEYVALPHTHTQRHPSCSSSKWSQSGSWNLETETQSVCHWFLKCSHKIYIIIEGYALFRPLPKLFLSTKVSKAIDPDTKRVRCGMSQGWVCVCQVAAPCGRILICENAWGVPLLGEKLWLINCLSWNRINHFSFGQVWYHYYALICIVSLEDDAMRSFLYVWSSSSSHLVSLQSIFTKLKCHFLWIPFFIWETHPPKYFLVIFGYFVGRCQLLMPII